GVVVVGKGRATEVGEGTGSNFVSRVERVLGAIRRLIAIERARLQRGEHAHRLLLVNSAAAFWDSYILANLECSHTSPHSRVRRATVRPARDKAFGAVVLRDLMRRQLNWSTRRRAGTGRFHLSP